MACSLSQTGPTSCLHSVAAVPSALPHPPDHPTPWSSIQSSSPAPARRAPAHLSVTSPINFPPSPKSLLHGAGTAAHGLHFHQLSVAHPASASHYWAGPCISLASHAVASYPSIAGTPTKHGCPALLVYQWFPALQDLLHIQAASFSFLYNKIYFIWISLSFSLEATDGKTGHRSQSGLSVSVDLFWWYVCDNHLSNMVIVSSNHRLANKHPHLFRQSS